MTRKTIKHNIKKTLFFSSSVILSTLFFVIYLVTKNECQSIRNNQESIKQELYNCKDTLKSLKRIKDGLIISIEETASKNYRFITPDPQPIIVFMDVEK